MTANIGTGTAPAATMLSISMPSGSSAMNSNYMSSSNTMPVASSATSNAISGTTGATAASTGASSTGTVMPFTGTAVQGKDVKAFAAAGVTLMVAAMLL